MLFSLMISSIERFICFLCFDTLLAQREEEANPRKFFFTMRISYGAPPPLDIARREEEANPMKKF